MSKRDSLERALGAELAELEAAGLKRTLTLASNALVDFTSNDYLGFAREPRIVEAAREASSEHGVGGRASRLLGGGSALDEAAEQACARWLDAPAALLFPSGYHANLGVLATLAREGDAIFSDELNHASLIDAARLSRARVIVYRHADVADLARALAGAHGARRAIVVTESVFSMDGDLAPLVELRELCARFDAWLVVDEAHACGLIGPNGAGAWAALERARSDEVLAARIVTGGKALGAMGAFVVGSRVLREELVNRARSFVFTTAVSPAVSGALRAAIELAQRSSSARAQALALAERLATRCDVAKPAAAIVPIVMGTTGRALEAARALRDAGFDARAVRPPTVPDGTSRLRIVTHSFNDENQVDRLAAALEPHRAARAPFVRTREKLADVLVIAGTDTGVGKTVVSALLARALRSVGRIAYWKPVQTGADSDTRAVTELAELRDDERFAPAFEFRLAASPHEAAAAEKRSIDVARIDELLEKHRRELGAGTLIIEPAGGLCVPWTDDLLQIDWLARHRFDPLLVARSGLGTLNHTLLSIEALRTRRLDARALVLVGEPHPSNHVTLARRIRNHTLLELHPFVHVEPMSLAVRATIIGPAWARVLSGNESCEALENGR